jgi:Flp pilus assembly protein TadG
MTGRFDLLRRFGRDRRGVAAVESALITSVFTVALFNAIDVGRYAYVLMETEQATQAGAQAAFVTCDASHVPATTSCPDLSSAVTAAIHGTSLGTAVSLKGAVGEGYYCLNAAGSLVRASDVSSKPSDCSAYGSSAIAPVLYLQVNTTYAYQPMFGSFSIAKNFPTPVTKTAWMRME